MDRAAATAEIERIFANYRQAQPRDAALLQALTDGTLYELFVLSELVNDLVTRGFGLSFSGSTLKFKASPGRINMSDPHFDVTAPRSKSVDFRIFVDIEFETLGHHDVGASDRSRHHEID